MKPTPRDYLSVLLAFVAVFLCGYGVGHLVGERTGGERRAAAAEATEAQWVSTTLPELQAKLALRPEQIPDVERELQVAAAEIASSRGEAVLAYHRHLAGLYDRLIALLDEDQAAKLRAERESLKARIKLLSPGKT